MVIGSCVAVSTVARISSAFKARRASAEALAEEEDEEDEAILMGFKNEEAPTTALFC